MFCAGAALRAQSGFVRSGNQAIPGATVTATQDAAKVVTTTDQNGHYAFQNLTKGTWMLEVAMFGFAPLKKEVSEADIGKGFDFSLQLQESLMGKRMAAFSRNATAQPGNALETQIQNESTPPPPQVATTPGSSNESFLVSGSLSPGLAANAAPDSGYAPGFGRGLSTGMGATTSQAGGPGFNAGGGPPSGGFAVGAGGGGGGGGFGGGGGGAGFGAGLGPGGPRGQRGGPPGGPRQFGNRRPSQIHGMVSFTLLNSAVNAKPFSFTGQEVEEPAYAQSRFSVIVGGPLVIPKIVHDQNTFFYITYFGTWAKNPQTFIQTVPTELEREGNFSGTLQAKGTTFVPVQLFDPTTHQPISGNIIPTSQISPISLSLLDYIPLPNQPGTVNNYQFLTAAPQNTDNLNARIQRNITNKDRLAYHLSFQHRNSGTPQAFGFLDTLNGTGFETDLSWTRTISARLVSNAQVTFNRNTNQTTPFFAYGPNVAQDLGIQGTSSNPLDYGPPNLNFTNFGGLTDGTPVLTRNQSQSGSESVIWSRGNHTFTFGMQYTRNDMNNLTSPNGRGAFNVTGFATSEFGPNGSPIQGTGFDFADFLYGNPQSGSIRYSDLGFYFRQNVWSGYGQDEWKVNANLTVLMGLRYEYFSPFSEKYSHMANLDIAPNYTSVAVVTPGGSGAFSGAFPPGLINSDYNNFAPRVGIAWKLPWTRRSTIIRSGYGIYYNGQAYIPFTTRLGQQPPFAISNNTSSGEDNLLTLATGFLSVTPGQVTNTYAIDKGYRTPYARAWNFTIQHELPRGFFVELGYLGTKGTHLDVQITPNEGPSVTQAERVLLGNALGYTYDLPVGNSSLNAFHFRATQRFRHGISMSAYYQYAKSIDDSSTFGGAGNTVAQNWLDIEAERGLSSFDRRQSFDMNWVLTSPVGEAGSRFAPDSKTARLLRDWQISGSITAQTGTPLTARVLGNTANLAQTAGVGSGRAEATGESISSATGFFNLNAYTVPSLGAFGNAGRNTIPGPDSVALNLTFGRSFQIGESRRRLEFRIEGNNVLNHVNYTNIYTVVNATNYGLASSAASMRTLDAVLRFRF